ncbi:uncharacterized protein LOC113962417 isoform X1 [Neopelma chrysocephalum]|uniref:uncharacterized protein LOC113962324 isoform X1 n=1 Tax=Neopelma chrysocephalum TaxID=114329 RepID=UPI000FCCED20|nr:uncharacterized protein LOC113962324 isoform X1 [Neopelma chrysocephalum]XP_027528970.1 uncharacterized protein LOC113962417 isoform X1 [Neopelma chrysocephalum]
MKKWLGGSAADGSEPEKAPPRELIELGQEPWITLWSKWETCTKIPLEYWGQQTPMEVLQYWEQFTPTIKSSTRLEHAGRMGGALLTAYKLTVEKCKKLQEQLNAVRATQLVQRQTLLDLQAEKNRVEDKCVTLAEKYAVRTVRHRQRKIDRSDRGPRVRAIVTSPDWDPEKWDGNIWSSSDDSDEDDFIENSEKLSTADELAHKVRAAPVVARG